MAKIKKKLAEKVLLKKAGSTKKTLNPFEVHINKQKYEILGQKDKNDRGLPGVSRAKAIKKRQRTLLPEYNVKNKSNKFMDRRIGEKNFTMTEEDRTMARFTAERLKHHNKKSIFNLADDEILTHRGQTLNDIEKFDDPRSDDDEEDDGRKGSGKLEDSFVGDAHFGGGILTRTGKEGATSHKDLIEQLIFESKKRKAEKQKTKEATMELTEKLDSDWKDLLPIVSKIKKGPKEPEVKQKQDDYDRVMRELKFEARGNPTDRLKSEDEVAKEEKAKLEKLEQDRLDRMRGVTNKTVEKKTHRSADDLDDNFQVESDTEVTVEYDKEGNLKNADAIIENSKYNTQNGEEEMKDEEKEEESSEAETEDDLSDLKESESESDLEEEIKDETRNVLKISEVPDTKIQNKRKLRETIASVSKIKDGEEEESSQTESKSDVVEKIKNKTGTERVLKISEISDTKIQNKRKLCEASAQEMNDEEEDSESEFESDVEEDTKNRTGTDRVLKISEVSDTKIQNIRIVCKTNASAGLKEETEYRTGADRVLKISEVSDTKIQNKRKLSETIVQDVTKQEKKRKLSLSENENLDADALKISEMVEKANNELPYTYKLPDSYESLQSTLSHQPPEYQGVIVERMIKCNHPSLAAENKENLGKLFIYLLQHLNDVATDSTDDMKNCFSVLNALTPHLYNLTQLNPLNALNSLIEVIKEKQSDYKNKLKRFPGVDVLLFLKLVSCLFSTSDFRHQVVTPSLVFISQMLTNCRVKTRYDISFGLFLVTLYLEYTTLSKRLMPSAVTYLMGIIHMAVPKLGVRLIKILPPFKSISTALVLLNDFKNSLDDFKMKAEDFEDNIAIDEEFKLRSVYTVIKIAEELLNNYDNLSCQIEIFNTFRKLIGMIPKGKYPEAIQKQMDSFVKTFDEIKSSKQIEYIIYAKKKPKALRLYEPNIQKVYDGKQFKVQSREKAQRDKLVHKYKKEMKGALREIRRDKSFLGKVKIKQQIQSDYERKEKVKQIYADASIQQSELNALDRKKKRK